MKGIISDTAVFCLRAIEARSPKNYVILAVWQKTEYLAAYNKHKTFARRHGDVFNARNFRQVYRPQTHKKGLPMKQTIIAAALAMSAMIASSANATPAWACKTTAELTNASTDIFFAERIKFVGVAKISCFSPIYGDVKTNAKIKILGIALGPAIRLPTEKQPIKISLKAGLASPEGLFGQYNLDLGASLNLIAVKFTPSIGVEVGDEELPAVEVSLEAVEQVGLGVRLNLTRMTISPLN